MHYLSSVYFVNQSLHVLGIFVAHHQEVYYIYTTETGRDGTQFHLDPANRQSTESTTRTNRCIYIYIYSIPPYDGLQICPKHVEVGWRNKLRINSASSWLLLHRCIEMHGQQNIKFRIPLFTDTAFVLLLYIKVAILLFLFLPYYVL